MADPQLKTSNVTPDVLEAAQILVMMKQGMRGFLEAQQVRHQMSYVYYTSLNPTISQLHYLAGHGIPFSALYDISPITPAAYQFSPLEQAHQEAYYGMLTSAQCIVGPPRKQEATGVDFAVGVGESESWQPVSKKTRLSDPSTGSPEHTATEKQESKRKRKNLTKEQLEILESVYEKDKYPHIDDRIKLEKPTNLTEDRIQVWFQNRRAKDRKKLEAQKLQQYYFESRRKGSQEYKEDGADTSKLANKKEPSLIRKNSGSDLSENSESDSLGFGDSPCK